MSDACPQCHADLTDGEDFCRECGHSLDYHGDNDAVTALSRDDRNSGDVCPRCGATHMVTTEGDRHLCESCGFLT